MVTYDFSCTSSTFVPHALNIVGIRFDRTACFRKGAILGPFALREASCGIESYSPYLERDLESLTFYDLGDLPNNISLDPEDEFRYLTDGFFKLIEGHDLRRAKVLTLGGEHSISYAPIKAYLDEFKDLLLIHLDAHADLRDGYQGFHYSHASIVRRALDHFGPGHQLMQYGIRSGTREEYQWMRERQTLSTSLEDFLHALEKIDDARPLYLTLDLDYFDPAYLPGTGTPEPGGETFHSFIKLIKLLKNKNLVGADIVELAPSLDPTGNSAVFAAKVARELIALLAWRV